MRSIIIGTLALLALASAAAGQPSMSREQTLAYLSEQLTEIQGDARELQAYAHASSERSGIQERIDEILQKAVALRDALSTNPYIQVTGFSVTIPWGVTFESAFPTQSETSVQQSLEISPKP